MSALPRQVPVYHEVLLDQRGTRERGSADGSLGLTLALCQALFKSSVVDQFNLYIPIIQLGKLRQNGLNSLSKFTDLVTGRPSLCLP